MKALLIGILFSSLAVATPVVFKTAPGATVTSSGTTLPVSAEADFVISGNSLTVTLFNGIVNPTSVLQNISDLFFDVYTAAGLYSGPASITDLDATAVNVQSGGSFTTSSITSLPSSSWTIGFDGGAINAFHMNALGTGHPDYTVIGSPNPQTSKYSTNGSFSTNSHNPFLASGATFTLTFGQAQLTSVDHVVFSFGTAEGITSPASSVPEPATFSIVGLCLVAFAGGLRKLKKNIR